MVASFFPPRQTSRRPGSRGQWQVCDDEVLQCCTVGEQDKTTLCSVCSTDRKHETKFFKNARPHIHEIIRGVVILRAPRLCVRPIYMRLKKLYVVATLAAGGWLLLCAAFSSSTLSRYSESKSKPAHAHTAPPVELGVGKAELDIRVPAMAAAMNKL